MTRVLGIDGLVGRHSAAYRHRLRLCRTGVLESMAGGGGMGVRVEIVGYGRPALDALRDLVAAAKVDDPMAPVTVLAPNNLAGIVARRHLAAGTPGRPGIAAIDVTTVARLAERIAAPLLAPRRPTPHAVVAAAWRAELTEDPGPFVETADHPATVQALSEAYYELAELSDSSLEAVAAGGTVPGDVVALYRRVRWRLDPDWYGAADVTTTAAKRVAAAGLGRCVLYLPQDLRPGETRFVEALARVTDVAVLAGMTGVRRADGGVLRLLDRLGAPTDVDLPVPVADRVMTASDADDEVRCVVRNVVCDLGTVRAHRLAVLYPSVQPYARLLHEQLAAAGIRVNGPGVRAVDERAMARTVLEILALVDGDVPRSALFRVLAGAPVRDGTGRRVPVSRWERLSRDAGVVAGDDWTSRLRVFAAHLTAQNEAERQEPEPRDWLIDRRVRDAEEATALGAFAQRLRNALRRAGALTTWAELTAWCRTLVAELFGDDASLARLPEAEQHAAAALSSLLDSLAQLDSVGTPANPIALRELLEAELVAWLPRVGRFGDGVLVAPLSAAVGLDLDAVYVVGLSEDQFPGRLRPDALLPDDVRAAVSPQLPLLRDRFDTAHRHLLAAFASARQTVVSFPRGDLRRSAARVPSRFLLPSLRGLSGRGDLTATEWESADYGDARATAHSFAGELLTTAVPATEQEWATRAAAAGTLCDDLVDAAVDMIRSRAGEAFTRFDGLLAGVDGLPDYAASGRAVSPTALELYAECPHAFLVQRLLGVHTVEQPEDIVSISPLAIGELIHRSIERLVTEFADELPGPGEPWRLDQHSRLVEIALAEAEEFRARGLAGHPRLWEAERPRIISDVERMLRADDECRGRRQAGVVASEMPFGQQGEPPVEIALPTGRMLMRGSADKVDVGADGTVYVIDIKTGSPSRYAEIKADNPVANGTRLQLPVYAHAAKARYGGEGSSVHAEYWFVRKDSRRIEVALTAETEEIYARTLSVLARSIAGGLFPARAPEAPDFGWTQCHYCNPDGAGHGEQRGRWLRKRRAPELEELLALIEPGTARPDSGGGR